MAPRSSAAVRTLLTTTIYLSSSHEFPGYRVWPRLPLLDKSWAYHTSVTGRSLISLPAIILVATSLQDKFQCSRYPQTGGSTWDGEGLWVLKKVTVCLLVYVAKTLIH